MALDESIFVCEIYTLGSHTNHIRPLFFVNF